ncbi:protein-L-isoaspartate(D-aspartate) O-methyltransferase [Tahibacter aquaticus]|uniref:Protein-L-isoaspartate O-methyltransferase n=1 Tax=Tahibacter aquaticus TaxID=520092 RepID=A0A4R6YR41_9GAMM|nr:protein-L-isoaspartate O-methyltransferase [Tahibacter aquaticus]TDR40329.1 protein-L-isoaspartate(D-aspartate) O-methyltransferase [Tahibacter aquaticus]
MSLNLERARFNMIEQQVRPWDVLDARVLAVLGQVQREHYVSTEHRQLAFADLQLPLGHGEFMMKPVIEGRVLQAVEVQPGDSVLEIGTGSGFLTACLARLGREVVSVEQHADLAAGASERLQRDGIANAQVQVAEAIQGFEPRREFDVIVLTGAVFALPEKIKNWLKPGGRLFAVIGESPVQQAIVFTRDGSTVRETSLFETDLAYLTNAAPPKRFSL